MPSSMASVLQLLSLALSCLLLHGTANQTPKAYVVYMGSSSDMSNAEGDFEASQLQMLSTVIPSGQKERLSLIHSYNHAFMGFSAMLTEKEASMLSGHIGVVSVFADPILHLHTTHSWDFLEAEAGGAQLGHRQPHFSGDVIIGIIDTGIWPESPSFNDAGIGPIPSRWKGSCMEGSDFKRSNCNRKLIGARYYHTLMDSIQPQPSNGSAPAIKGIGSPRDTVGHGTHTASTAAGSMVHNANYYGLAQGTARGGSPYSRVAMYKACSLGGCSGSTILKAIDDAVKDGVDIISISVGMNAILQPDFLNDPIAIGAFHATQKGVMVVCSGGNDGPSPYTVVNSAPWVFTVAASNIDREFQSAIVLGNRIVLKGCAINFSNLTRTKLYPLALGGNVAGRSVPFSEASNCYPGSLDAEKAAGKIIVCIDTEPTVSRRVKKIVAENAGARGLILIDEVEKGVPLVSGDFPFSDVGDMVGVHILRYINSTKNPTASILPTVVVAKTKPAPVVAFFSSRGPGGLTETILKPDATAPGVGILASTIPATETGDVPFGKKPSNFAIQSGTSMACPHVTGAAAFLKSAHPTWTPSMIKSALMTTATPFNNIGTPLTNSSNNYASPHEMGAGEINPLRALNPGLVYETTTKDYLHFLCYYGYKEQIIGTVSGNNFTCPIHSSEDLISNLNYPSISITKLDGRRLTVTRTVTNVGPTNSAYVAMIDVPTDLLVKVSPAKLIFSNRSTKASFNVAFWSKGAKKGYRFGSVTWSDSIHFVRTVFAVNVV